MPHTLILTFIMSFVIASCYLLEEHTRWAAYISRVFIKLCHRKVTSTPNLDDRQNIFVAGKLSVPNYA